jgi:hypothetical protein
MKTILIALFLSVAKLGAGTELIGIVHIGGTSAILSNTNGQFMVDLYQTKNSVALIGVGQDCVTIIEGNETNTIRLNNYNPPPPPIQFAPSHVASFQELLELGVITSDGKIIEDIYGNTEQPSKL